ncbi:MAG: hypothetical protein ACREQQ_09005 [Candidatus Binatia bacterium]
MRPVLPVLAAMVISCVGQSAFPAEPSAEIRVKPRAAQPVVHLSGEAAGAVRHTLLPEMTKYDLKLTFAGMPQREYLSEVAVRITTESGRELISTTSKGPMLYAKLPKGRYRVAVTFRGQTQVETAIVGSGKQTELNFFWKT